jgi:hypothetical protein
MTYVTGDGASHPTREAALAHARRIAATTGQIIAIEDEDDGRPLPVVLSRRDWQRVMATMLYASAGELYESIRDQIEGE